MKATVDEFLDFITTYDFDNTNASDIADFTCDFEDESDETEQTTGKSAKKASIRKKGFFAGYNQNKPWPLPYKLTEFFLPRRVAKLLPRLVNQS